MYGNHIFIIKCKKIYKAFQVYLHTLMIFLQYIKADMLLILIDIGKSLTSSINPHRITITRKQKPSHSKKKNDKPAKFAPKPPLRKALAQL